eukprot:5579366-Amphidinium_carterae.1
MMFFQVLKNCVKGSPENRVFETISYTPSSPFATFSLIKRTYSEDTLSRSCNTSRLTCSFISATADKIISISSEVCDSLKQDHLHIIRSMRFVESRAAIRATNLASTHLHHGMQSPGPDAHLIMI